MPDIPQCEQWIDGTKKLLGVTVGKTDLEKRNEEIAKLLQDPALKTNAYKDDYEELATRAFNLTQGSGGRDTKAQVEQLAKDLRLLKKKVRLEAAKTDPTANPKIQGETLKAARNEPFYRDKRERFAKTLQTVAKLPGTSETVKRLQAMLDEAEELEPDYKKALTKLTFASDLLVQEGVGLTYVLDEAKKTSEEFISTAGGDKFQKKLTAARTAVDDYEEVAGSADSASIAKARGEIATALKLMEGSKPDEKQAGTLLDGIAKTYGTKASDLGKIQDDVKDMMTGVTDSVREMIDYAPPSESADLRGKHQIARALYENQKFVDAKEAWTKLKQEVDIALPPYKKAYEDWEKLNKKIEDKSKILANAQKLPALQTPSNHLITLLEKDIKSELLPANKFSEAFQLATSENILGSLIELETAIQSGDVQLTNPKLAVLAKVNKSRRTLDDKLKEVQTEMEKLDTAGGDSSPFQAIREEILNAWRDLTALARMDTTAIDSLLQQALVETAKLKNKVLAVLNTPEDLKQSKKDQSSKAEAAKFENARKEAENALRELAQYNLPDNSPRMKADPDIKTLRTYLQTLSNEAKTGTFSVDKVSKIASDCKGKMGAIEFDLEETRKEAKKQADELLKKVAEAEKMNGSYKKFYAAIREHAADLLGVTSSSVISQVNKAAEELVTLASAKLPDADDFKEVDENLKAVTRQIDEKQFKDYQPEAQAVFEKRLKTELKDTLYELSPAEALKSIEDFKEELDVATKRAETLKGLHSKVQGKAKELLKRLPKLKKDAPKLYESLKARLEAANKCKSDGVDHANLEVSSVEILLRGAKDPTAKDKFDTTKLKKLDKKAELDDFEAKRQKAAYEASLQVFERGVKIEALNLYDSIYPEKERNKDVYHQIDKAFEQAKKLGEKGSYTAANESLLTAMNLAKYFLQNPLDGATAARKQLNKLNQQYKTAVSNYLKELSELEEELKTAQDEDGTALDTTAAQKIIKPLFAIVSAGALDNQIKKLSVAPSTVDELDENRTHQELALRNIRLAEKALESNPVLKHVIGNPIKPVAVTPIKNALRSLAGAVMAS